MKCNDITQQSNLQVLASLPRWVAYSGAPMPEGKINKAPLNPASGYPAKNNTPSTWGTRKAAEARAKSLQKPGCKPGVGIEMGDTGDGLFLCGVDLDGCHSDGLEPWAEAICKRFNTYSEISPSGEGVKLFFRVKAQDVPAIRKAMGKDHRTEWKRSSHHGAELHVSTGYFTVTGRAYGGYGDALRLVPLGDVLWLVQTAGPALLTGKSGRDETRSADAFRLLLDLFRAGSTEEEAIADIERDKGPAGDWWGTTDQRQRDKAVANTKAQADAERAEVFADFDLCWTAEELEEIEIAGMIGDPAEVPTTSKAKSLSINRDDFGAPMMQGDKPIINMHNAILYLGRNVDSVLPGLRHNLMTARDEWRDGPLTDAALVLARTAMERLGMKTIGKELVADAALAVARFRQYHPIRDDLARVRHDGKPRLDSWLVRHAGAEDSAYVRAVGRKFLIQMVARVMQPGCKADHTLVLSGPQGQNKSTACRILAGAEYFSETLPSITGDKTDAIRHLQGKWLVELAELAPSRKSESEDLKAFLSGAIDRVRLPYARLDQSFPRQCVFVGTTNEDQFLRDATGGRRFWPVPVRQVIDIVALAAERDQLLAEATAAFNAGEPWWLDRDFEAEHARPMQEAAFVSDGWADAVAAWLDKTEEDFDGTTRTRDVDFHPELSRFFHREVSHL